MYMCVYEYAIYITSVTLDPNLNPEPKRRSHFVLRD